VNFLRQLSPSGPLSEMTMATAIEILLRFAGIFWQKCFYIRHP